MFKSKKDLQHLQKNLHDMQQQLSVFNEDYYHEKVMKSVNEIRHDLMIEQLKELPMNVMSTLEKDLPLNALSIQGVKTIYDLHNLSELELRKFDGVGPVSAATIFSLIKQIKESVMKDVRLKIDPDELNETSL